MMKPLCVHFHSSGAAPQGAAWPSALKMYLIMLSGVQGCLCATAVSNKNRGQKSVCRTKHLKKYLLYTAYAGLLAL